MKINIFIQNSFQHEIHHVAVLKDECLLPIFFVGNTSQTFWITCQKNITFSNNLSKICCAKHYQFS